MRQGLWWFNRHPGIAHNVFRGRHWLIHWYPKGCLSFGFRPGSKRSYWCVDMGRLTIVRSRFSLPRLRG